MKFTPKSRHYEPKAGIMSIIRGVPEGYLNDRLNRIKQETYAVGFVDTREDDGSLNWLTWARRRDR